MEDRQGAAHSSRPKSPTPRPIVASLIEQAERRAASGDFEQADAFFQAAVAADVTATAGIAYGIHLFEHDRHEEAEFQLRQAWDAARRTGRPTERAITCSNLALLFLTRGDLVQATQFEQLALSAWFEGPPDDGRSAEAGAAASSLPIWLRRMTAAGWFAAGEDEAASRLMAPDRSSPPHGAEMWFDAGALAERLGDIERSLQCFDKSLEAARRCGDEFGEALCLERLATLWRKSGHWRRADRALEAAEQIHDRSRRFRARSRCQSARSELASPLVLMNTEPGVN